MSSHIYCSSYRHTLSLYSIDIPYTEFTMSMSIGQILFTITQSVFIIGLICSTIISFLTIRDLENKLENLENNHNSLNASLIILTTTTPTIPPPPPTSAIGVGIGIGNENENANENLMINNATSTQLLVLFDKITQLNNTMNSISVNTNTTHLSNAIAQLNQQLLLNFTHLEQVVSGKINTTQFSDAITQLNDRSLQTENKQNLLIEDTEQLQQLVSEKTSNTEFLNTINQLNNRSSLTENIQKVLLQETDQLKQLVSEKTNTTQFSDVITQLNNSLNDNAILTDTNHQQLSAALMNIMSLQTNTTQLSNAIIALQNSLNNNAIQTHTNQQQLSVALTNMTQLSNAITELNNTWLQLATQLVVNDINFVENITHLSGLILTLNNTLHQHIVTSNASDLFLNAKFTTMEDDLQSLENDLQSLDNMTQHLNQSLLATIDSETSLLIYGNISETALVDQSVQSVDSIYDLMLRVNDLITCAQQKRVAFQAFAHYKDLEMLVESTTDMVWGPENIWTNEGNAYNTTNGMFFAPTAGIYEFTVDTVTSSSSGDDGIQEDCVEFVVNDDIMSSTHAIDFKTKAAASMSLVVHLDVDDTVTIRHKRCKTGEPHSVNLFRHYFNGFLIHSDFCNFA